MIKIYKTIFGLVIISSLLFGCNGSENNNNNPEPSPGVVPGTYPILSEDGKTLLYGVYPQTNINDEATINALNQISAPQSNGWYLYNNEYYAKINASPYANYYTFDNGTKIVAGTIYWFKCEPISWDVISITSGEYLIHTTKLLDVCQYYTSTDNRTIGGKTVYPSNYEYSKVRGWLNDNFYKTAFNFNDQYVQITNVNNSASTTRYSSNPYVCNDTVDKVFLLSYKDLQNNFASGARAFTTDFARARGSSASTYSLLNPYSGYYWTRTPHESTPTMAYTVNRDGEYLTSFFTVTLDYVSVRPVVNLKIA